MDKIEYRAQCNRMERKSRTERNRREQNRYTRVRFPVLPSSGLRLAVCVARPKAAPISLAVQTFEHIPFINSQQLWGETLQPWTWPKNQKAHISKATIRLQAPVCVCVCACVCLSASHNHCVKVKWLVLILPREIPRSDYIQINFHAGLGVVRRCYAFIIACA